MNNPYIPTKTGGISQQWQAVSWIVALLVAFGLGLGTGYLVWGKDAPTVAGPTAPSAGLTFLHPIYASEWNLPAVVTAGGHA